jgi:hypothetical protein
MKRSLPHLLWSAGLLFVIIGTLMGPGVFIPGEQPTPQQVAQLKKQLVLSDVGFVLLVIGAVWVVVRLINRRFLRARVI